MGNRVTKEMYKILTSGKFRCIVCGKSLYSWNYSINWIIFKVIWIVTIFSLLLGHFFFESCRCTFTKLTMTFITCSLSGWMELIPFANVTNDQCLQYWHHLFYVKPFGWYATHSSFCGPEEPGDKWLWWRRTMLTREF